MTALGAGSWSPTQTPAGEGPLSGTPEEGHCIVTAPRTCLTALYSILQTVETKKENAGLRGKRVAGHRPQARETTENQGQSWGLPEP